MELIHLIELVWLAVSLRDSPLYLLLCPSSEVTDSKASAYSGCFGDLNKVFMLVWQILHQLRPLPSP